MVKDEEQPLRISIVILREEIKQKNLLPSYCYPSCKGALQQQIIVP